MYLLNFIFVMTTMTTISTSNISAFHQNSVGLQRMNHWQKQKQKQHRHTILSKRSTVKTQMTKTNNSNEKISRRNYLLSQSSLAVLSTLSPASTCSSIVPLSQSSEEEREKISIALEFYDEAYVLYYRIGGDLFRAIVDTGSPFLMIPGSCSKEAKSKYGCYKPTSSNASSYENTYEVFDGFEGEVEWRSSPYFNFVNVTTTTKTMKDSSQNYSKVMYYDEMIFGVSDALMGIGGPGGVFFGLVKQVDDWIRPSFLSQTNVQSFQIDLSPSTSQKTLTLSTVPLIPSSDNRKNYIPLNNDLYKRYNGPTNHYTAIAKSIIVNDNNILKTSSKTEPIYVIFDTGVSGMVISQDLLEERYIAARKNRERSLWGKVDISFATSVPSSSSKFMKSAATKTTTLTANKPLTTPLIGGPWKNLKGYIIVIGLAFLDGHKMTVDINNERLLIE